MQRRGQGEEEDTRLSSVTIMKQICIRYKATDLYNGNWSIYSSVLPNVQTGQIENEKN